MPLDIRNITTSGEGGGGASNSFETWNVPAGTNPVAESSTDTINLVTGDGSLVVTGTSGTDTVDFAIDLTNVNIWSADQTFNDNINVTFGTGGDADIDYDGTNLVVNPKVVGSGKLSLIGDLLIGQDNDGVQLGAGTDAEIIYDGTDLVIEPNLVGSGAMKINGQAYTPTVTLTDAATIATDCSTSNVFEVTLTANRTLGAPTNLQDGATYIWVVTQDATGSQTLAYNAVFKFPGGLAPILSTGANDIDVLTGISDGTDIYLSIAKNFS